jgi:hypothetical protein
MVTFAIGTGGAVCSGGGGGGGGGFSPKGFRSTIVAYGFGFVSTLAQTTTVAKAMTAMAHPTRFRLNGCITLTILGFKINTTLSFRLRRRFLEGLQPKVGIL